ncbi:MAG: histidine phosphatase family protein [Candidatus Cloacimonetes bacterium]|nr:histidine phosphatase family protein [Candidatus Cloacimonadota bacterium]
MKKLYVIRHAKSSWADISLSDFERPLKKRGKKDAPLIGKILNEEEEKPDLILSSSANRAISTAKKIAKELKIDKEKIVKMNKLYAADLDDIIDILSELSNEINVVYIFGHNPELFYLVLFLCDRVIEKLPTCAVAAINLQIEDWGKIRKNCGKLERFLTPKMLK